MINSVHLAGKIVGDEIRNSQSRDGTTVVNFRLYTKHPKAKNPIYIDVETWGAEADRIMENAEVGDYVLVEGELRMDQWESQNGTRSKIKITAHRIIMTMPPSSLRSFKSKSGNDDIEFEM